MKKMEEFINDLDKKISKAQNITGNLFDDLTDIRISFNRLKKAINYSQCCKSDSEQLCDKLSHNADIMVSGSCMECGSDEEIY